MAFSIVLLIMVIVNSAVGFEWGYKGQSGPAFWPGDCQTGKKQSPINIKGSVSQRVGSFNVASFSQPVTTTLLNNGHTAELTPDAGAYTVSGAGLPGTYVVKQFHFHWGSDNSKGSEHTVDGRSFPMEMHIVTHTDTLPFDEAASAPQGLAVLAFFFQISSNDNPELNAIVESLWQVHDAGQDTTVGNLVLKNVISDVDINNYIRYNGSLTTPGCFESVIWSVIRQPIRISENQIKAFRALKAGTSGSEAISNNFRPVHPINGRVILLNGARQENTIRNHC